MESCGRYGKEGGAAKISRSNKLTWSSLGKRSSSLSVCVFSRKCYVPEVCCLVRAIRLLTCLIHDTFFRTTPWCNSFGSLCQVNKGCAKREVWWWPLCHLRWAKSSDSYRRAAGGHISPQNTEIGAHRPCVCCAAIRIVRLTFIRATFVPSGTAELGSDLPRNI